MRDYAPILPQLAHNIGERISGDVRETILKFSALPTVASKDQSAGP